MISSLPVLPFPAALLLEGRALEGPAWLLDLINRDADPWATDSGQRLAPEALPWRRAEPWQGALLLLAPTASRRFTIAGVPFDRQQWLWQFVEEDDASRHARLIVRAVDALPDSFSITTRELDLPGPQFLYVNPAFTAMSGYPQHEVLGQTPRILQGPRTERAEIQRLRQCLESGAPYAGGAVNYRRTGEEFWNEWQITGVPEVDGRLANYVSVMKDATANRVAIRQITTTAEEWTAAIDVLTQMIVLTDQNGRIARCNEAFRSYVDLPFATLIGVSLAQILTGADQPPLPIEFFTPTATITAIANRTGRFLVRGLPVSRQARIQGWVHTIEDVTSSEMTAAQLYRLVVASEQANDGIAMIDTQLRVDYANSAMCSLLRQSRGSLLLQTVEELGLLPRDVDGEDVFDMAVRKSGHTVRHELIDGDRNRLTLEISIGPVLNKSGEAIGFVLIARDLSERERLLRIAEHASTTSNVGHWLGGLRHELGNPVNSVKMALTVLHSHIHEFSELEVLSYIERAQIELGRVEYLLRTLKTFSLYENPEFQSIDLMSFIERVSSLFEPDMTRQSIQLDTFVDPSSRYVLADPRALHQVVVNLVTNAADALDGTPGRIELRVTRVGKTIELSVADNGPGIAAARLERLFLPFETTKRGGTGLGLVLVRKLVTSMRGTVTIESEVGAGTTARVRLDPP
jgi:PAS domain S-box-containing protein